MKSNLVYKRVQFEVSPEGIQSLNKMMSETGARTRKELFNNALTLLEWAIEEKREGRIIASVDEKNERYREIVMPILFNITKK